jgi:hypothetical protein
MKQIIRSLALLLIATMSVQAQDFKEVVQPLSPKATKGFIYSVNKDDAGTSITFKIKGDKKSEEVFYEEYSFDNALKFLGSKDVQEKKEQKEDVQRTAYYANVGGTSSFDVNSMKLKLNKKVLLYTWNHEKQTYVAKKFISSEVIKPKNDNGKVYLGYASYSSNDENKSDVFVITRIESKDKSLADKFYVLLFNSNLEIIEKPMDLNGSYSLVYCDQLKNDDVVAVFAPNKGAADISKYVYFRFDIQGNVLSKIEFTSPASALLINDVYEKDGDVFCFGTSSKSKEAFKDIYSEYAPIYNPGYTTGANNIQDYRWQKCLDQKMDNFHLLKFSQNQFLFGSTTPVADFKSKFKTAPGDKGATPYSGRKFAVQTFTTTPDGDYLIAGQLTGKVAMGTTSIVVSYEDIVCFHFDKLGNLKAQYGLGKLNNDKKSEIFSMIQNLYPSADGKSLYWEILEVKGAKGYANFSDAYNGRETFYAMYYPRFGKINRSGNTLGAFKTMGDEKYFLQSDFTSYFSKAENSITYIGNSEDSKNLWLGKVMMP